MAQSQLFRATFDLVSCALVLLDEQGRVLKVNTAFTELFGHTLADVSGETFLELLHQSERLVAETVVGQPLPWGLVDQPVELSYRHKDGSLLRSSSKLAQVGAFLLVEIVPVPVETQQSLDEFLEQDHWLQRITETAPGIIGTFRLSSDGTPSMPWISPGYEQYYGVTVQELERDVGILFERIHPEDVARVQEAIAESARSLAPWQCEYRVRHPQMGEIWLEGRARPTLEADGAIIWFGFLHDISERKGVEQALLESEERFRLAFESAAIGMALLSLDGHWLRVNPYLCEMLGRAEEELLQTTSQSLTHSDDVSREHAYRQRLIMGEIPHMRLEKRYRHHNGQYLRVQLTASVIVDKDGSPLYFIVQIVDLSRAFEAEGRLSLMDFALSHVHEAAFLVDSQARFRYVNDEACRSLGYSREELLRMTVADIDPDWSNEQTQACWFDESETPVRPPEIIESRHRSKTGDIFPVEISISSIGLDGQNYNLALARDITERRRLQAAQQYVEKRYREVFDNSSDCLYLLEVTDNQRFHYLEINTAFERASGFYREQLIGRYVGDSSTPETARKILAPLEHCLASGEIIESETELELPAGNIAISSTFIPVRDEQGKIYRIVGISRDISERKRMETRLLTSEQQFRALAENSLNLIIRYDLNCRRIYVNPAFERETGLSAAQALQLRVEDSWSADSLVVPYLAQLRQVIATGEPMETVLEWPCPETGKLISHAIQLIAERGPDGSVVSVLAKGHNITALKRHERLEESRLCIFEQLARGAPLPEVLALVTSYIEQNNPDFQACIMLADDDGRYLRLSSSPRLLPELSRAFECVEIGEGMGICGTAAWRGTTVIAESLATHPYCGTFRELARHIGLRACWAEPIKDSVGKVLGTFCIFLRQTGQPTKDDLTQVRQASHWAAIAIERKRAERLLFESEQRYRDIFDNSLDALFLLEVMEDGHFRYIEVNPAFERSVGRERAGLIGETVEQVLPRSIAAAAVAKYQRCVQSGVPLDEEEERYLPGGPLFFHTTLIPVRDTYGRVQRIVGIARDITQRKYAERVLHTREQEFRALVENTPDVIARYDLQCRFLYANPAAQSMLGCPLDFLLGKKFSEMASDSKETRLFQEKLEHIIRTCKATEEELSLDLPAKQGGDIVCFQIRLVPERDQHGVLVSILAVGRNVSAMRAAQQRLKESHAQLRQLASYRETAREEERKRIAREIHDELGQQLTALRMGISLLRLQFGADQPLLVERVQMLMGRIDETIQVVRNVATSLRPSALDMGLTSALEWLVAEFSRNTGVPCSLRAPSARLELDDERATAIFRVIQESLTNVARHAQASRVGIHLECSDERVLIEVRDNGKGFDPKQLSEGSLGMLGMRERGHMLGGTVTVHSTVGQGACVQVNIPFQIDPEAP
ncbi:PAS domain S-box protein [Pseudomonas corrugata]|uniref:PAS domain S-box protein n=1 Tax=Pseudomonas corrugata TaxID=47879 RepID=UPI002230A219|nr:PAS domain S-box protein [Pseudomonas corrugata]UZD98319.1 PAS domain S-box protein [Pseudomonas corrugata]